MPQPVKSYGVWYGVKEHSGNLFTGYAAGVIQTVGLIFGLIYGTRESVHQCKGNGTTGSPRRLKTDVMFRDGLPRSSNEVSVMGMERRGQVIQF